LAISPNAAITEQNFPNPPSPLYPATTRAPDPGPAVSQTGSFERPEASPVPSTKVNVKDRESPIKVAVNTFHRDAILGSQ
jgi:hypothetical protein